MHAHYDPQADIVWLTSKEPSEMSIERSEETGWGLIDRDRDGNAVGIELWRASTWLPEAALRAFSEPASATN